VAIRDCAARKETHDQKLAKPPSESASPDGCR
jgi:hypothetical protein